MKCLTCVHFTMLALLLVFCNVNFGQTLYVATNGDNTNGQTWATAYTTIQAAVNAAGDDDTIIVGSSGTGHGDGVYPETVDVTKPLTIESESGYETTTVGFANSTDHIFHVQIDVHGVTIRGFSVFGATASGEWQQGGIYLEHADYCTIENNRCGWDDTHKNNFGIYLNYAHYNTIRNNICNKNIYRGIRLWGADYNVVSGNECSNSDDGNGIHLNVGNNYNLVAHNVCENNGGNGIYVLNSGENTIAYNTCRASGYMGLRIAGPDSYNATIGNISSGNSLDGLFTAESTYGVLAYNQLFNNGRRAVYLSTNAKYSHFYHNDITGSIHSEWWAENDWSTPTEMCYFYNPTVKSLMGNYYAGMDHTDTDGDGITDADMDLPGAEHTDEHPLASEPNQYAVQTWYVATSTGLSTDPAAAPGWIEMAAETSTILRTEAAAADIDFDAVDSNDGWTGRIRFNTTINGSEITVDIGSSDINGANFIVGPQVTLAGSASMFTFETNGSSFTVPAGKAIAMQITNNSATTVYVRHGAFSYISAPAGTSQPWPGVLLGDIAGDVGVDLVDFTYLAARWARTNCASTGDCEGADLDGLGSVDIEDLIILCSNWLQGKY